MENRAHQIDIPAQSAVLDAAHVGDIRGAFGTIPVGDIGKRTSWMARFKTFMAIIGPGLIVMVGDNDAGAFGTYTQAGQNYGTALLWTLMLLIPVLYVNQEMVLRLGVVSGVGHARLILERFGRFWGAFSVIDLFLVNALTIVTEFIGISLGLTFLGVPKIPGVIVSALLIMMAVSTGNFRRFERFSMVLVFASLLLVPVFIKVHPPLSQVAHDFLVPSFPQGAKLSDIMLLVIGIVGTTVAPWQLFFQQSYVIDKRITPRFIHYERWDLVLGIVLVIIGAVAMMAFAAHTFAGKSEFGNFVDAGAVASGIAKYFGKLPAQLFAVALIDACIIGASAVSLSTAYALGDVLSMSHSLHRKPKEAIGFYAVYFTLIVIAAALVLIPGTPLGLLTNAVQTLAGVLLPSASVFLLLLCNDKEVLGPWVNGRKLNIFTAAIVTIIVMLSIILTAAVIFPDISSEAIVGILVGGSLIALVVPLGVKVVQAKRTQVAPVVVTLAPVQDKTLWRMPTLAQLKPMNLTTGTLVWMGVLRGYLLIAICMVAYKVIRMALV